MRRRQAGLGFKLAQAFGVEGIAVQSEGSVYAYFIRWCGDSGCSIKGEPLPIAESPWGNCAACGSMLRARPVTPEEAVRLVRLPDENGAVLRLNRRSHFRGDKAPSS